MRHNAGHSTKYVLTYNFVIDTAANVEPTVYDVGAALLVCVVCVHGGLLQHQRQRRRHHRHRRRRRRRRRRVAAVSAQS